MNHELRESLERATFCTQLAETESDPEMKSYLLRLATDWTRAAQQMVERAAEELLSASRSCGIGMHSSFVEWRMSLSENRCPLFRDMR